MDESYECDAGCIPSGIVNLNVGGQAFATSRATLIREPLSMLGRMCSSGLKNRTDEQGRVFIDRDPRHFRLILNFLRDGACVLPEGEAPLMELLQEAEFYQLEGLKAFVLGEEDGDVSAQRLRTAIQQQIRADPQLREAARVLVECAFGRGCERPRLPPRRGLVEVALREAAINPLFPQPAVQARDETLFVAFQQHIKFEGGMERRCYHCKHEPHFIHEDGGLSYDPAAYGAAYADRFHIKTLEVYRHHCLHGLSEEWRALREAALFCERNADALQWALEAAGFRDVRLCFHARQPQPCDACSPDSPPASPSGMRAQEPGCAAPVLCHVRLDVHLSL